MEGVILFLKELYKVFSSSKDKVQDKPTFYGALWFSKISMYLFFISILFHSSWNRMSEMIEYHNFLEVHRMYVGSQIFINIWEFGPCMKGRKNAQEYKMCFDDLCCSFITTVLFIE